MEAREEIHSGHDLYLSGLAKQRWRIPGWEESYRNFARQGKIRILNLGDAYEVLAKVPWTKPPRPQRQRVFACPASETSHQIDSEPKMTARMLSSRNVQSFHTIRARKNLKYEIQISRSD
jgi:hypothetical protein